MVRGNGYFNPYTTFQKWQWRYLCYKKRVLRKNASQFPQILSTTVFNTDNHNNGINYFIKDIKIENSYIFHDIIGLTVFLICLGEHKSLLLKVYLNRHQSFEWYGLCSFLRACYCVFSVLFFTSTALDPIKWLNLFTLRSQYCCHLANYCLFMKDLVEAALWNSNTFPSFLWITGSIQSPETSQVVPLGFHQHYNQLSCISRCFIFITW